MSDRRTQLILVGTGGESTLHLNRLAPSRFASLAKVFMTQTKFVSDFSLCLCDSSGHFSSMGHS